MSRTDRHRPYRVQLADRTERNRYGFSSGHKYVEVLVHNTCGCWSCTDPLAYEGGHRVVNKRTRRAGRRDATLAALDVPAAEPDDPWGTRHERLREWRAIDPGCVCCDEPLRDGDNAYCIDCIKEGCP